MKTFSREEALAAYEAAPTQVRQIFDSEETYETIDRILETQALPPEASSVFGREVGYLLLSLLTPQDFFARMVERSVSQENAEKILAEVHEKLIRSLQPGRSNEMRSSNPTNSSVKRQTAEAVMSEAASTSVSERPIPPAPNTTPLVKEYVADPYREPFE